MIRVVQLEPSDWARLKAIRLEALKMEPQAFGSNYERDMAHPDALWQERLTTAQEGVKNWAYFAADGDELVGMISGYRESPEVAEVTGFYVRSSYRGRGIGVRLLQALMAHLDTVPGLATVKLTVNSNQLAAQAAYRRLGFEAVSEDVYRMGDGVEHAITNFERRSKL